MNHVHTRIDVSLPLRIRLWVPSGIWRHFVVSAEQVISIQLCTFSKCQYNLCMYEFAHTKLGLTALDDQDCFCSSSFLTVRPPTHRIRAQALVAPLAHPQPQHAAAAANNPRKISLKINSAAQFRSCIVIASQRVSLPAPQGSGRRSAGSPGPYPRPGVRSAAPAAWASTHTCDFHLHSTGALSTPPLCSCVTPPCTPCCCPPALAASQTSTPQPQATPPTTKSH